MTDYREIIRLKSLEFSNVTIANNLCYSRNTVSEVLKLAETHSLGWPIPDSLTNSDIKHLFYPDRGNNEGRRLPDSVKELYRILKLFQLPAEQMVYLLMKELLSNSIGKFL